MPCNQSVACGVVHVLLRDWNVEVWGAKNGGFLTAVVHRHHERVVARIQKCGQGLHEVLSVDLLNKQTIALQDCRAPAPSRITHFILLLL